MIVVTGATGNLGSLIVQRLLVRFDADQIVVSVRNPAKAAELLERGVRARYGDFAQPETLAHAFEGATQLLLVSSNAQAYGGDPVAQHRAAIEAARRSGVRRILYTSHVAASKNSQFLPMHTHARRKKCYPTATFRGQHSVMVFYASRAIQECADAIKSGVFEAPRDGKVSWTTHEELAEAAAVIIATEGCFEGPTPPLTGSQALDLADLAEILSVLLRRPIGRQFISDGDLETKMATLGLPTIIAKISIGLYAAARKGEFAIADLTLAKLLGRKPTTASSLIASNFKKVLATT